MKIKCFAHVFLNGIENEESSLRTREFFPFPWKKTGFLMGLHLKGKGQFAVQLPREIP